MTWEELYQAVLEILPNAQFGEDNEGQIIIFTNLREHFWEVGESELKEIE